MPIYEYRCTRCEQVVEVMQRMGARAPGRCKECSGRLEKLVSRTAFQLKGGGWYSEGYSRGKPDAAAKAEATKPKTDSAGKGEGTKTAKSDKKRTASA